jgi:hypothetical protein
MDKPSQGIASGMDLQREMQDMFRCFGGDWSDGVLELWNEGWVNWIFEF